MKRPMKRLMRFRFAFLIFLTACTSANKPSAPVVAEVPPKKLLSAGQKFLASGKYEEALAEFNGVLKNQTTAPEIPYALYYSAIALQMLNRCPEAIERYRKFAS